MSFAGLARLTRLAVAWPAKEITSMGVGHLAALTALQCLHVERHANAFVTCQDEALEALAKLTSLRVLRFGYEVSISSQSRLSALEALHLQKLWLPGNFRGHFELITPRLRGPYLNGLANMYWEWWWKV